MRPAAVTGSSVEELTPRWRRANAPLAPAPASAREPPARARSAPAAAARSRSVVDAETTTRSGPTRPTRPGSSRRRVGAEVRDRPAAPGEDEAEDDQREVVELAGRTGEHGSGPDAAAPARGRGPAAARAGRCSRNAPARPSPRLAPTAPRAPGGTGGRRHASTVSSVNVASRRSKHGLRAGLVEPVERGARTHSDEPREAGSCSCRQTWSRSPRAPAAPPARRRRRRPGVAASSAPAPRPPASRDGNRR